MADEADIIQRESEGNPFVGWTGVDLSNAPLDQYGFPIWNGAPGPQGRSHAAGLYQFEPATWREGAAALGIKDFSPESQKKVYDWTRAKYGDAPWAASEPLKPGEHRWIGAPTESDQGLNLGTLEKSFAAPDLPPAMFLDSLLAGSKGQTPPELEPPGGKMLDQLLSEAPPEPPGGRFLDSLMQIQPPTASPAPVASPRPPTAPLSVNPIQRLLGIQPAAGAELPPLFHGAARPPNPIAPQEEAQPGLPTDLSGEEMAEGEVAKRLVAAGGTLLDTFLVQPLLAGARGISGQDEPGSSQAIEDAMAAAGLASTGSIGRGGFGAGPRLPMRREPPPIGREIVPHVGDTLPGTRAPALAEGGGARGGGGEPPIWRGGSAETAPEGQPSAGIGGETPEMVEHRLGVMRETQDQLFTLWEQSEEYRERVLTAFRDMPSLTAEEKLQVERYLEWQPGMPQVPAPTDRAMRIINEAIKPAQRQAARDFEWLKSEGVVDNLSEEQLDEITQGYLHRLTANKSGAKFAPFAGVRSLRQRTSAMRGRQTYALQYENGEREVRLGDPPGLYGTKTQTNRGEAEVRRATTEEVERETDIRYLHDPVLATLQNMTELHLARRNVEALKGEILPRLVEEGLATTDREAGIQQGFKESKVPALRNYWFEERLRNAFDDFYQSPQALHGDLTKALSWIGNANRFAIASMFVNPLGHMRNVTGDAILARGNLWFSPPAYVSGARHMREAFNDVRNLSDFYRDVMKAGGSLKGVSVQNRVAYDALLNKARDEMTTLPQMDQIARSTGIWQSGKQMAEAFWNAGQKFMWGFHDMLYLQRIRELMGRGRDLQTAVQEADRFIAGYRVPASVGEGGALRIPKSVGRALSVLNQDHTLTAFGRYRYDKLKAIANVLRDAGKALSRSGMTGSQRAEALGRLGTMLLWSTALQYGINFALQKATGNPEARAHVPGAMGIPANAARVADDLFKANFGEAAWDFWMGVASVISPLPAVSEGIGQLTNTNFPVSSAPIRGKELPGWEQALQSGTHAAQEMVPFVSDLARMYEGKGIGSLGISTPDPAAVAAAKAPHPRDYRREQRGFYREFPWLNR